MCIRDRTNFNTVYEMTLDAVKTITYTMEILLPVLIALLISMGQVASGTIMSPLLLTSVTIFQAIIKNIILPAIFVSTVLSLINCLTEKDYVNQLSRFIRQVALFAAGLIMTLMSGIIAVQGLIAKTSDGLLIGTAKYSLDAFIPIVGGFTSDTICLLYTSKNGESRRWKWKSFRRLKTVEKRRRMNSDQIHCLFRYRYCVCLLYTSRCV